MELGGADGLTRDEIANLLEGGPNTGSRGTCARF
jgi:hypothetical protein